MINETLEENAKPRISVHMAHHCKVNSDVSVFSYRQNTTMFLHYFLPPLKAEIMPGKNAILLLNSMFGVFL